MATEPVSERETPGAGEEPEEHVPGLARQVRQSAATCQASSPAPFDPNLTDLIIDEDASVEIDRLLAQLVKDCRATTGMVVDRAGQVITSRGDTYQNELMLLGALVAGTYASSREMARILHEENFRMLLQEGANEKIFTQAVGEHWLVSIIFGRQTHLGLVKVMCERATLDLGRTLEIFIEANERRARENDGTLARVAQDTIDLLFRPDDE